MKIKLGKRTALAVIVIVAALVFSSLFYLNSQNPYAGNMENISLGNLASSEPYIGLVYVALDQNFFAQNGLNLTITNYDIAPNVLNAVLANEVNFAISSEYSFVASNALKQGTLSIIATIDKSQSVFIVARKDTGIENMPDLTAKKIGVALQTALQFYLQRFLELNNIQNVTLVNLAPTEYVTAIVNGTVDAVVATKSSILQVEDQLPNGTVVWSVQSDQDLDLVVSCRNDWIMQHPELITRFLKALAQAETYVVNNPALTKAIIGKGLNVTEVGLAQTYPNHQFSLSLDQSLVVAMENEARWMITNKLTNQTVIPDFLDYLYLDGLSSVKPESVNVIR